LQRSEHATSSISLGTNVASFMCWYEMIPRFYIIGHCNSKGTERAEHQWLNFQLFNLFLHICCRHEAFPTGSLQLGSRWAASDIRNLVVQEPMV